MAGAALLGTINISYADVTLGGVAGVSALVNYTIGTGGTLRLASTVGVSAGTAIAFTGIDSHLVIGSGVNLSLLSGITGFAPGSNIDLTSAGFSSYTYVDNVGTGTGGTLTLIGSNGLPTGSVPFSSGDFTAANFNVHPDLHGGTLVDFATMISSVSATPANGDLTAGRSVVLQLGITAPVIVTGGTPTLALNDGGTAAYDAVNSTATNLVFNYTVQPGQNTPDLAITGTNLNGASVTDLAGNPVSLGGAVGNPVGTLQIDTTAPTITGISTAPGNGSLAAGQAVAISLTPSEAVTIVGGIPTLLLNDGGIATYDAVHSTAMNLVFNYTVQPGQNTGDLTILGSNLNGATIADAAGNLANLAGAVGNPAGILQIDTTAATITGVSTTPGSGALAAGQVVTFNLTPSEVVTVAGGLPTLTLNDGGTATYDAAHSTATNLVFSYVVQSGQNTADLAITAISLNGATIADAAGNPANLAGAVGNPAGILQIDTIAPTITGVSTTPGSGVLGAGQVVAFNLTPSEAVTVAGGLPTLILDDGGTATYDPTSSTATNLVFKYIVRPGDSSPDLFVTGYSLNGATITDPAGNPANLAGAIGNPPGVLQINPALPLVISVYSVATTPGSGDLAAGNAVALQVTLTGSVTVAGGPPTLTLSDGGTATYDPASSTSTLLIFRHTIQPGQNTADLAVTAISLNGAVVTGSGVVDLSGAVTNPGGILQVDTTAPTISSVTTTPGSGDLNAGQIVAIDLTTSEAVVVNGGTPTLMLNDGGNATYDATNSTATKLVFKYTVQAGQNTADLTVTGYNLNGAAVADGAGNSLNLSGSIANPPGTLQIDTIAPTALSVVMSGSLEPGQVFKITAYISEPVTVSGGPVEFLLANGGIATYDASQSTPTMLVSTYTVPASGPALTMGDATIVGFNQNGASAVDGAGNLLDGPSIQAAITAAQGNFSDVSSGTSPTTLDVYRFFDKTTGTHFYTQNASERENVLNTRPDLVPEGPNGVGLTAVNPASNDPNMAPVFRFFDLQQGTHFFTASASERDTVIATRPDLVYEPASTFYEHTTPQAGDTAVYRFFDSKFGTHFYTDDPTERGVILQTRPDLIQEGVGFYEPMRNPAT